MPLLKQIATNNKALVYITWDISKWQGQKVHILVHDSSTAKSWGNINIDDIRVGCYVLGDGKGLSFNILGQANEAPLCGPIRWAYAKSTDAVHWREQPVALYPAKVSNPSDDSGRFPGSGVIDKKKNELRLILTDYINLAYDRGAARESVIMAISKDGKKFDLAKEPVVSGPPKGEDPFLRDLKVFRDPTDNTVEDGCWRHER
ncbi:hypothetical protein FOFC_12235 [Fusarium oxysporum]|nr:hypothetical protein FOFC_12235 [Fusarium oxysporum]